MAGDAIEDRRLWARCRLPAAPIIPPGESGEGCRLEAETEQDRKLERARAHTGRKPVSWDWFFWELYLKGASRINQVATVQNTYTLQYRGLELIGQKAFIASDRPI